MGTVLHGAHAPKSDHRTGLDDWLLDGELDRCARERERESLKLNGNGHHSAQQGFCDCPECRIGGKRYALHRVPTDCNYSRARSSLVDRAVELTFRENGGQWSERTFNAVMDRLVAQLGL